MDRHVWSIHGAGQMDIWHSGPGNKACELSTVVVWVHSRETGPGSPSMTGAGVCHAVPIYTWLLGKC